MAEPAMPSTSALRALLHHLARPLARRQGFFRRLRDGNDHTVLAAGLNYKLSPTSSVDVAYHHGFVKRAPVNTTVAGAGTLVGNYKVSADVHSVQYNHGF